MVPVPCAGTGGEKQRAQLGTTVGNEVMGVLGRSVDRTDAGEVAGGDGDEVREPVVGEFVHEPLAETERLGSAVRSRSAGSSTTPS